MNIDVAAPARFAEHLDAGFAADPLPSLSAADIDALAQAMDTTGFAVLRDVIAAPLIESMRVYIDGELKRRNVEYLGLAGPDWILDSPLAALSTSAALHKALAELYSHEMKQAPLESRIATSIRALSGGTGAKHSWLFHYDSYVVTALIPLQIPDGEGELPGDLVMYPNLRGVRRRPVFNIVEKLVVESPLACRLWKRSAVQRAMSARTVRMRPGNIYFFWGMRSLHANQPCLPTSVRCTALFHFGDPHAGSLFKRLSARHHQARLRRLSHAAAK
ncbi:hypothetical protein [Caballeronia mineralivorans]|nr:hypothetical protein [Caballeronia mineralivorans]